MLYTKACFGCHELEKGRYLQGQSVKYQEPMLGPTKTPSEEVGRSCPVFGVESGGPVIGLGLLLILFGIFPFITGTGEILPLPLAILFIGFGIFLITWGIRQ
jgi:hypothetical protein